MGVRKINKALFLLFVELEPKLFIHLNMPYWYMHFLICLGPDLHKVSFCYVVL